MVLISSRYLKKLNQSDFLKTDTFFFLLNTTTSLITILLICTFFRLDKSNKLGHPTPLLSKKIATFDSIMFKKRVKQIFPGLPSFLNYKTVPLLNRKLPKYYTPKAVNNNHLNKTVKNRDTEKQGNNNPAFHHVMVVNKTSVTM